MTMEKDMFGVSRLKVNLHMHTTLSDGSKTPEEAAEIYKKAGYDVVAITDHWIHRDSGEIGGLRILSGAEYNIGGGDASTGVYHILGIGCSKKPNLTQEAGPQKIIDEVHRLSLIHICLSLHQKQISHFCLTMRVFMRKVSSAIALIRMYQKKRQLSI